MKDFQPQPKAETVGICSIRKHSGSGTKETGAEAQRAVPCLEGKSQPPQRAPVSVSRVEMFLHFPQGCHSEKHAHTCVHTTCTHIYICTYPDVAHRRAAFPPPGPNSMNGAVIQRWLTQEGWRHTEMLGVRVSPLQPLALPPLLPQWKQRNTHFLCPHFKSICFNSSAGSLGSLCPVPQPGLALGS